MRRRGASSGAFLVSLLAGTTLFCACQMNVEKLVSTAEIGVFYGGEIQQVRTVELSTIRAPKIGFRVHFPLKPESEPGSSSSTSIELQIARPGAAGRRVRSEETLTVAPGQTQLDHLLALDATSKRGVWNIRVSHQGRLLADRALYLVSSP